MLKNMPKHVFRAKNAPKHDFCMKIAPKRFFVQKNTPTRKKNTKKRAKTRCLHGKCAEAHFLGHWVPRTLGHPSP
jgi:hypothetical protein